MRQAGQDITLEEGDLPDRLTAVLTRVVQNGKALEVNTWRGRTVEEWAPLLRRFRALGGEYVTVGSDSHTTQEVGKGVRDAYQLLAVCGFSHTARYRARTPRMERIAL